MEQTAVYITVTPAQLKSWAECSQRMTNYENADADLLITIVNSQNGVPVRLILDKGCVQKSQPYNSS